MPGDLVSLLEDRRRRVEEQLRESLGLLADAPASLRDAVAYSLLAPGKRLRPVLTILAAEVAGGTVEAALPAACAVEMAHTYSLIHDDLPAMDDDDLRRGQPTCHTKFGEALAILAGDALLTLAFERLSSSYPPRTAAACCRALASAAGGAGMIAGQVDDLSWEGKIPARRASCTIGDLEQVHARKTGALFRVSLRLGVLAAQGERPEGPDAAIVECLERYGRSFGLLFQITDDLLDAAGTSAATGKRVGKDAAKGKITYPGLLGLEESRRKARELAAAAENALRPIHESAGPLAGLVRMIVERDR